jgi:hypothetical protein
LFIKIITTIEIKAIVDDIKVCRYASAKFA